MYTLMKMTDCVNGRSAFLAASLLIIGSVPVPAGPITYTSQYIPNALPSTGGGTVVNPSWDYSHSAVGTYTASVSDGILSASTMPAVGNTQSWKIGQAGSSTFGTSSAWSLNAATGATIDFTIKVNASTGAGGSSPQVLGGFNIFVGDGSKYASLYFSPTQISLWGATMPKIDHSNTEFQTFRIAFSNGLLSLYEAGNDTALISNVAMINTAGYNQIYWGDGSSLVSGGFQLSYMGWNNTMAEYSAPPFSPIPEPGAVALVFAGCLVVLLSRWRVVGTR